MLFAQFVNCKKVCIYPSFFLAGRQSEDLFLDIKLGFFDKSANFSKQKLQTSWKASINQMANPI